MRGTSSRNVHYRETFFPCIRTPVNAIRRECLSKKGKEKQDNLTFIRYLCLFLEDRKTAAEYPLTLYLSLGYSTIHEYHQFLKTR